MVPKVVVVGICVVDVAINEFVLEIVDLGI